MALHPKTNTQILGVLSWVLLLLLCLCRTSTCKPNTAVKSVLCNSGTYTKGDPFTVSLAYVLSELQSATPSRRSYDFRNISPYPNAFAYGHAACNQTLTTSDCAEPTASPPPKPPCSPAATPGSAAALSYMIVLLGMSSTLLMIDFIKLSFM